MDFLPSLPVAIAVIGYLAYQDWRDGKFKRNKAEDSDELTYTKENALGDMKHLRMHFNDELTPLLTDIRDGIKGIQNKFDEYDKYGFPTRDCKKKDI